MRHKSKPRTTAELALLGTDTDGAIAKRLGRSKAAVQIARYNRGIPPYGGLLRSLTWGTVEILLFEKYADAEIAKLTRRPLEAVKAKRAELRRNKR